MAPHTTMTDVPDVLHGVRTVELTNTRVVVDGLDISHLVVAAQLELTPGWATLRLEAIPDEILYVGEADVSGVPLDGIARLRTRLAKDEA